MFIAGPWLLGSVTAISRKKGTCRYQLRLALLQSSMVYCQTGLSQRRVWPFLTHLMPNEEANTLMPFTHTLIKHSLLIHWILVHGDNHDNNKILRFTVLHCSSNTDHMIHFLLYLNRMLKLTLVSS